MLYICVYIYAYIEYEIWSSPSSWEVNKIRVHCEISFTSKLYRSYHACKLIRAISVLPSLYIQIRHGDNLRRVWESLAVAGVNKSMTAVVDFYHRIYPHSQREGSKRLLAVFRKAERVREGIDVYLLR